MSATRLRMYVSGWLVPTLVAISAVSICVLWYGSADRLWSAIRRQPLLMCISQDLGSYQIGSTIYANIEITNRSQSSVHILGGRFGCSCISTNSLPAVIRPRQHFEIPIEINADSVGFKKYPVTLYTDVASLPELRGEVVFTVVRG